MASVLELMRSLADLKASLAQENILTEQFEHIYVPGHGFAKELLALFQIETEKALNELTMILDEEAVNYHTLDFRAQKLQGSCLSIGATRMANNCSIFSEKCWDVNNEGCILYLQYLKDEFQLLKNKIENIQKLEKDIIAAGGSIW